MKIATTATGALQILWEEGFFKSWHNVASLVVCLEKRDNHFSQAELGMALKRAKYLTRKGNRGSYEYIQKHPYISKSSKAL